MIRRELPLWTILSGLGFLALGTGGGMALGGFVTGGTRAPAALADWSDQQIDMASQAPAPPPPPAAVTDAPENYVCRGCGPRLSERQALAYSAGYAAADGNYDAAYDAVKALPPLPPYQPMPYEGDAQTKDALVKTSLTKDAVAPASYQP